VIAENLAHLKLKSRTAIVDATLRQLDTFDDRFGLESIPDELMTVLEGLTALPGNEYGEIVLAANAIIRNPKVPSFGSRVLAVKTSRIFGALFGMSLLFTTQEYGFPWDDESDGRLPSTRPAHADQTDDQPIARR
jgi:hypothetical protein